MARKSRDRQPNSNCSGQLTLLLFLQIFTIETSFSLHIVVLLTWTDGLSLFTNSAAAPSTFNEYDTAILLHRIMMHVPESAIAGTYYLTLTPPQLSPMLLQARIHREQCHWSSPIHPLNLSTNLTLEWLQCFAVFSTYRRDWQHWEGWDCLRLAGGSTLYPGYRP